MKRRTRLTTTAFHQDTMSTGSDESGQVKGEEAEDGYG
jgi:hypothetical protein